MFIVKNEAWAHVTECCYGTITASRNNTVGPFLPEQTKHGARQ